MLDVNAKNPDALHGNTALHYVFLYLSKDEITDNFIEDRKEILKLLLDKEPDLTIKGVCEFTPQQLLNNNKESKNKNVEKIALALTAIFEEYVKKSEEVSISPTL